MKKPEELVLLVNRNQNDAMVCTAYIWDAHVKAYGPDVGWIELKRSMDQEELASLLAVLRS